MQCSRALAGVSLAGGRASCLRLLAGRMVRNGRLADVAQGRDSFAVGGEARARARERGRVVAMAGYYDANDGVSELPPFRNPSAFALSACEGPGMWRLVSGRLSV